jgi:hypothetical protein
VADVELAHAAAARVSTARRAPRMRWLGEVFMFSTMRRPSTGDVGREMLVSHPKVVASHDTCRMCVPQVLATLMR